MYGMPGAPVRLQLNSVVAECMNVAIRLCGGCKCPTCGWHGHDTVPCVGCASRISNAVRADSSQNNESAYHDLVNIIASLLSFFLVLILRG